MTPGKNKLERDLQKNILDYLENRGGYWIKIHVASYQKKGEPDIVGCYKGKFVAFELKKDEHEKPKKLQRYKLEQIKNNGGYSSKAISIQEISQVLDEIDNINIS